MSDKKKDVNLIEYSLEKITDEIELIRNTISEHGEQNRNIIDSYYQNLTEQLEKLDDKEKYTEQFARKEEKRLKEKAYEECREEVRLNHVETYRIVSLSTQNINNFIIGILWDINISQRSMFDTMRFMKEFNVAPTQAEAREMLAKGIGNRLVCRAIENLCATFKMKVEYYDPTRVTDYLESEVLPFLEKPFNGVYMGEGYTGEPTFMLEMNPMVMFRNVPISNSFNSLLSYNLAEESIIKKLSELIDYSAKTEIKVYDAEPATVAEALAQAQKPKEASVENNLIDNIDCLNTINQSNKKIDIEGYIEATNGGLNPSID